ncbi:MAG TPA: phosphatidate cytidylyltransferase [Terriglobales bacterium]|nr:phosphatidate cytidylyltransferase [Terriglobales bacterium]
MIKRIATAAVLIPIVLLLVLSAPFPILAAVAGGVALLTIHEFLRLTESYGVQPFLRPTYIFVAVFFVLLALDRGNDKPLLSTAILIYTLGFAAAIAAFVFLTIGMRRQQLATAYPAASASVFAFAYIALPLGFLVQLREQPSGAFLVIYLLLVVWAGDIFAYFVGRSLGQNLLSPRISPKKTWEGAAASFIASVAVGAIFFHYSLPISSFFLRAHLIQPRAGIFGLQKPPLWPTLALSAVLNIAAQLGDLVESLLKRGAGVKDSGAILPGHGGMLDRIDALLFAAPVLWYYAAWHIMQ